MRVDPDTLARVHATPGVRVGPAPRLPAPGPPRPDCSEEEFVAAVVALARWAGYLCAHFRPARVGGGRWRTPCQADAAGFPDFVCLHPISGRVVVLECKVRGRKPKAAQARWLAAWRRVPGARVGCVDPTDWEQIVLAFTEGGDD